MKSPAGKGAIELIEEATHLLRRAPAGALCAYAVGTLPFVLGLLYFWSDMSRSAQAETRLPAAALALTAGFFWMKTWQCVFAHRLFCLWSGEPIPRLTFGHLARVALHQAILQPAGLFLIPLALALLIPLPWIYGFFVNATALGARAELDLGALTRRSWANARLRAAESIELLALLKLFALFVLLNVVMAMAAVPYLLEALLGVDNALTRSPTAMLNTTFAAVALGITYLCLDPLLKCVYVLRCFYGEALPSGADLKADLAAVRNPWASAALGLGLLMATLASAPAGEPQPAAPPRARVAPEQLSRSIEEVLDKREYLWRLPREQDETNPSAKKGLLARLVEGLNQSIETSFKTAHRWVQRVGTRGTGCGSGAAAEGQPRATGARPCRLRSSFCWSPRRLIGWVMVRLLRAQATDRAVAEPSPVPAVPDVSDENIGAEQLPEDGWIQLGRELMERGRTAPRPARLLPGRSGSFGRAKSRHAGPLPNPISITNASWRAAAMRSPVCPRSSAKTSQFSIASGTAPMPSRRNRRAIYAEPRPHPGRRERERNGAGRRPALSLCRKLLSTGWLTCLGGTDKSFRQEFSTKDWDRSPPPFLGSALRPRRCPHLVGTRSLAPKMFHRVKRPARRAGAHRIAPSCRAKWPATAMTSGFLIMEKSSSARQIWAALVGLFLLGSVALRPGT
jgi:hypothetical protein